MISIIIPTYNEAGQILVTLQALTERMTSPCEILVCDGGSTDGTADLAEDAGARVVRSTRKGRAPQMNAGAAAAKGEVLYFLHADTIPPPNFITDIESALQQGYIAGCFMLAFDYAHWFLRANCWFTRFNVDAFRFGDQSLFINKSEFQKAGGFCEAHLVLEDQQMVRRLRRKGPFKLIRKPVVSSARKYRENGIFKTQAIFFLIYLLYHFGVPQQTLVQTYRSLIRADKI